MESTAKVQLPTDPAISAADFVESLPSNVRSAILKAREILTRNGATQIILFGSMARKEFDAESDIDLCVSGLTGVSYFRAVGECLKELDFHVSIVPLENIWGYFRQRVLREGKVIYEG